jgi:hypothetical protein
MKPKTLAAREPDVDSEEMPIRGRRGTAEEAEEGEGRSRAPAAIRERPSTPARTLDNRRADIPCDRDILAVCWREPTSTGAAASDASALLLSPNPPLAVHVANGGEDAWKPDELGPSSPSTASSATERGAVTPAARRRVTPARCAQLRSAPR